jgi:radical SAM superfamily enzyme
VARVKARPFLQVGAHLILGIPGEDFAAMRQTIRLVCETGVQHLKIHHLQVIKGTELERIYLQRPFTTFTVQEYLDIVSQLLMSIPPHIVVHRLWSLSEAAIIVAPLWNLSNFAMGQRLNELMAEKGRRQGALV